MTDLVLDVRHEVDGQDALSTGAVHLVPTKRRTFDGAVVLPEEISVRLDGTTVPTISIRPTPVDLSWTWTVVVRATGDGKRRYVNVPDAPTVQLADLAELDPATFQPLPDFPTVGEAIAAEAAAREAADDGLSARVATLEAGGSGPDETEVASWVGTDGPLDNALTRDYSPIGKTSPARSNTVAVIGDSITSYNAGAQKYNQNQGWFWRLLCYSAGRMRPEPGGSFYGAAGITLHDVLATYMAQVEALDEAPGFVIIAAGANDMSAGGGLPYSANPQATADALDAILARIYGIGSTPILSKVPPTGAGAQIAANVVHWNLHIDAVAKARGLAMVDMCTPLAVDPAVADTWKPGTNQDVTHPSALGHDWIARFNAASSLMDLFAPPTEPYVPTWNTQLLTVDQGRFLMDSNSDGLADGWGNGGTQTGVVKTLEPAQPGDGAIGNWQRIDIPAGAASGWIQRGGIGNAAGWQVGDRVRLRVLVETSGYDASGGSFAVQLLFFSPQHGGGWESWTYDVDHGACDVTVPAPAGSTNIYVRLTWNGVNPNPVTLRFANVRLDNLDATPYA